VKKIRKKIASLMTARSLRVARWLKPALLLAFGLVAGVAAAQPANDYFTNATVITGLSGSTNGDNTGSTLEACETNALITDNPAYNPDPITNSVWFAWTAPGSGTVQFDTGGSSFETVLAVWTTSNTNTLCDPSLTPVISDDDTLGNNTSQVSFPVVAGQTYYLSVNSYDDPVLGAGVGPYVLNWNAHIPTLSSGTFKLSSTAYSVAETDSSAPLSQDGGTVNPSIRGARITITRPPPAYGRTTLNYWVTNLIYTNTFYTNYYGTNILTTFMDTNGTVNWTNSYTTNIFILLGFEYYNNGYQYVYTTNFFTNSATLILGGVFASNYPVVATVITSFPTNLPVITNVVYTGPGYNSNLFGYDFTSRPVHGATGPNGSTITNGLTIYYNFRNFFTNTFVTNYFGTNLFYSSNAGGGLFSTNYFSTNVVVDGFYYTNSLFTNGTLTVNASFATNLPTGSNYFAESILNASNQLSIVGGFGQSLPFPTNIPPGGPPGFFSLGSSTVVDASSNIITTATNSYSQIVTSIQLIPSSTGFTLGGATLTFDDYQMSQDIIVPVAVTTGPDGIAYSGIPSLATITLSNPQLDPLEDTNAIIAPSLNTNSSVALLSALSSTFTPGPGVFNLERSTFRVDKNVGGGNAIISVNRIGGNPQDSVSVDYYIDPTTGDLAPHFGGYNPPANYVNGYNPANTFPLQAGSDYATANSDFTPMNGTLSWGAYDYNPKQITIPIFNNGLVEFNEDLLIQLYNPQPEPPAADPTSLGEINAAILTIPFDSTFVLGGALPGQQPAGAVDRTWNKNNSSDSYPDPYLQYPGTAGNGGYVYAVATQPDGSSIIAGSFNSFDSVPYNGIVRALPNGYEDLTFQGNFSPFFNSGANDFIHAVALQPNGSILIGGNFTSYNGVDRHRVARLNSDGSLDTTFNPGLGANGTVSAMVLESSGQVIIAGGFTTYNGTNANYVARLNSDGTLDTTFNSGAGPNGPVVAVAVDASGRVVIGGSFDSVAGVTCGAVARLNVDGSLDTTFAPGIGTFNPDTLATDPIDAVAVQPNGQILIGGSFSYLDLVNYNGLARLNTDGTVDLTFHPGNGTLNPVTGNADTVDAILLQPDGNILIGGNFTTYNQTRRVGMARVQPDGSLDTSFMDTAYNQFAGVPNHYHNPNAVNQALYPTINTRNIIYALALEADGNVIIGGSFARVGGGSTRDDIHPRSNVARLIGGATPGPGNMELSYSSYTVNNSDGYLYVSLVRTNGNLGITSATFSTNTAAPGPGIASGADFTLLNQYTLPTWDTAWANGAWDYDFGDYGPNYNLSPPAPRGSGATTGNPDVYVYVSNPGNITGNLSANFAMSSPISQFSLGGQYIPLGAALGAQSTAPLTIIDNNINAGVLGFSSPTYSVVENGSSATITVTRTNGSAGSVTVGYATSNGTATNGIDYIGITNTVTLGIGVTSTNFTISTLGHYASIQPDKTVNLRLFTPIGGATLGLANATLTLINGNYQPGHVSFSAADYPINENAGPAVITVNRLGGSVGTLGVTVIVAGGPAVNGAVNGVNYIASTNTLTWASGDATSRTITVPVMDDGVVTPNLVAYLQLTNSVVNGTNNPEPLAFGSTNATLTIDNIDSAGSMQFSSPAFAIKKYGGYALIPIVRTNGSVGTTTIAFSTIPGTALPGSSYTPTNGVLTFTNGQVCEYISVSVTNNPAVSGLTYLSLVLTNPTGGAIAGITTNVNLYIIDSDIVNETPGSADTTYSTYAGFNNNVYAMALQSNNQLLVGGDFTMADGIARNRIARLNSDGSLDPDFSLPSSTMGANGSVRSIAIQSDGRILVGGFFTNFNSVARGHIARINPDGTLDSLFNPGSGADNLVYAVAQTTVAGQSKVLLAGAFASVGGNTFNGVGRLNSDGTPDSLFNLGGLGANATVYALAVQPDGKIVIGGDFTAYNGATNFNHIARLNPDGSVDTNFAVSVTGPSDSVRAITLQLDGKILIGGIFTSVNGVALNHIARLNPDGTVDASFVPGLGADDAVFSIALQTDTRIVLGGEFRNCSGVTRNRITRLNPDGSVDPSINFGTGANDFVGAIAVQEDTIAGYPTNVPDEKIIIGGGFTQYDGVAHPHLTRIFGGSIGGSGSFEYSSASYQVDEYGTNVLITVLRTGGTTNTLTGDVFVTAYTTTNGTAVSGVNYTGVTNILDFPLGEVVKTFTVPVMGDGVVTPNLTMEMLLTNATAPATVTGQTWAWLTIINDDSTLSFSSANYSAPKNIVSGTAAINLVRQGGTNSTATVTFFTTTNGTALVGTDYTPVAQTVTFGPNVSTVTVNVPINNNGIAEGNRTVGLQLANPTGTTLISPTNATLTIIDTASSPGQLTFAASNYSITEGGGLGYTNAYITVIRTNGSSGTVSVGFGTQDGTALSGSKYISTNGVLTFGDGETSKSFNVQVVNTATAEGPESLAILLSNPTGGATLTTPTSTTLTIYNTNTGIAFVSGANAFTEPSGLANGTVLLNVVRYNNTNGTTTVYYSTTNGTAVAGTNFVGVTNALLTFNPGDSIKQIAIATIHDPLVTGDLFFTVGLSNPSGSAQLTPPSYTVVTDHDADAGISFLTSAITVFNNSGTNFIPVFCSNTNVEPVTVSYSAGGGTAVSGVDYAPANGTLTFTNNNSIEFIALRIIANNQVHSNRTFNLTLSGAVAPGVLVPPSVETITIAGTNTPYGLSFLSPIIISGAWGATNANNTFGAPEIGDPAIAGSPAYAPVWFQWKAPANGEVTLDTIGSYTATGSALDTLLAVYTGNNLSTLSQVAANDDIYPPSFNGEVYGQFNYDAQNIFNTNNAVSTNFFGLQSIPFTYTFGQYFQPYGGPSELRFNAQVGQTYYIEADTKAFANSLASLYGSTVIGSTSIFNLGSTKPTTGNISLNWAYHPSGILRFATEKVDLTGNMTNADGSPMLLFDCAETESDRRTTGTVTAGEYDTTFHTYYTYDAPGLLVTVTRVAGSSGRIAVDYTTVDGNTNSILNGDIPAVALSTNLQIFQIGPNTYITNIVYSSDYTPVTGTLVFDDYEMSKTILIPITDDDGLSRPNRDFTVVLSNPRVDPSDAPYVPAPRVDQVYGRAMCRILDCDIDPKGPTSSQVVTNIVFLGVTNSVTNTVITLIPTNPIFNFQKKSFRVGRDVQSDYWGNTPVTVYVNRMGTNTEAVTLAYRIDNYFLDKNTIDDNNNEFPLLAGSEYAVPTSANPPLDGTIYGPTTFDFNGNGGESGTLSFSSDSHSHDPGPIHFTIHNNQIPQFNKDIHIGLYQLDSKGNPLQDGMVAECTLTILFDDGAPPAGSVDELYNPDFAVDMAVPTNNVGSAVPHPGTEAFSEVYSVAVMTNDQTIIGGAFRTYTDGNNDHTAHGLARLNLDGSMDTTFNAGDGIPPNQFIRSVALSGNQVLIGGNFSSYNGTNRAGIARVNADGSLDPTFNPGTGANGTVWSVLVQSDGRIIIGGEFTSYNSQPANYVARLNNDGSLDTTFNTSNLITGPVYSMAMPPQSLLNFNHASSGGPNEDDQVLNLGPLTSGTLTVAYNMLAVPDDMRIFYGTTNVAGGTGVLLYDTGNISFAGTIVLPFAPTNGITTNILTIVMNQGGSTNLGTAWFYNASVSGPVQTGLMIGGLFNVTGQSFANIAKLNSDGSLDTSFIPGSGPDKSVLSLAWQLDNKVIVGGSFQTISGISYSSLARLNPDGSIDPNFYIGSGADNTVNSVTLQSLTGQIYVGGPFTSINGTHRLGFARLNPDGTVDTSFMDTAYNQLAGLPRVRFSDPPGAVYSSGIQSDGNVIIGGTFSQVGGGQFDEYVRPNDYTFIDPTTGQYTFDPDFNVYANENIWPEPKVRDAVRNRGNVARLIGGATPGPGNIGLAATSYGANKTQSYESVSLIRTNGFLGYATANFSVQPGLAQNGVDYSYSGAAPFYPVQWEYMGPTRQHSDGLFGPNGLMITTNYNLFYKFGFTGPAAVNISIINSTLSSGNLSAQFQMANPGADMFYLGGQLIPLGVALGESAAPLSILDNSHNDGVFSFGSSSYVATNASTSINLVRSNGLTGTVQVYYQTTTNGSTAVAFTDYRPTNGVVTFNPAQSSAAFPLTILRTGYISTQEKTVNLQLNNIADLSSGNASLGLTNAVARIINPNFQGYLTFSTNAYYGNLSAGTISLTVSRAVGSLGTINLQCVTANGTALSGQDYVGITNNLLWNNGDVSPRTVVVPLINHSLVGPNKQFFASLLNPTLNGVATPALFGTITNAVLTIINDNSYGAFQFSSPTYQVNENGGTATITVTRSGSALGTASVTCSTADATAFAGTNYVATTTNLTFAPGQIAKSFNVPLLDDHKTNPPPAAFYFAVSLSGQSAGSSLGSPSTTQVHMVDAESYIEQPGSVDPSFDSTAGMNASVLALALQANGQIVAGGSFTVANGTAMNRIARLNTDGTLDDNFLNGLSGADGSINTLICQTDQRIVVGGAFVNMDGIVRQRIARLQSDGSLDTSFNPGAGADSSVFALAETFINGSRGIYVGGAFSTYNGTNTPGVVRLNNDGSVDGSFAIGQGVNGTVYALAAYPTNSVYNAGKILVGGLFTNYNGSPVANLLRLNGDGSMDSNFIQNASVNGAVRAIAIQLDGGVLIGGDFTNVDNAAANHIARLNADGTLDTAFNLSETNGINGTVNSISLQADNRIVVGGQFNSANGVTRNNITRLLSTGAVDPTINFGDGANGAVNALLIQPADGAIVLGGDFTQYDDQPHAHIVRIYGNSMIGSGAFQFTTANYQVDENGNFATITIQRTGGTGGTNADGSGDVFITCIATNGTAVSGVNYIGVTNIVDFPVGEVLKTVYVPVIDDQVITPDLTVNLSLLNPTPGTAFGQQSTATLKIVNDDSAVEFQSSVYTVPKSTLNGVATIDILRLGSTSGTATVNFSTGTNGTAVVGTDYIPTNALITFNPGDSDKQIQIAITNNLLPEGNRTVSMLLTNAVNSLLASPSNATLTISDTLQAPGQFCFSATNFSANSSAGVANLTVIRTNGTSGSVTVYYSLVPGTALPNVNYAPSTNNSVTFYDGDSVETIQVQLINNTIAQSAVNLSVNLSMPNPPPGASLIAPTNTVLTIYNTNAVFAFTLATNSQPENASPATLIVQRFNNTNITSYVNYATTNGTALAGINYSNTSGTLTFGAGESFKSISIPLINQTNVNDLTFGVGLSSPVNAQLIAPSNAVVIEQASAAGFSFTNTTMTVFKNAGNAVVTVVCSNPRVEQGLTATNPLTVTYTTMDGTAKAGINYQPVTGQLVFTNGIGTNTFNVLIFNNQAVTGDESFSVALTNATAPGMLEAPSTQTVVIAESNAGMRFSQGNYNVYKTGVFATITVNRTDFTNNTASVDFAASNGSAVAGQNFYPTNGTLVFTNGVTSQSFNVALVANNLVQPNLTVLLQLSNPTNSQLVSPDVATLTILETGGSYVIPAGAQVVTNYTTHRNDGIIGSNDTVQVLFGFRDAAGNNVTNLVATLLATNGVTPDYYTTTNYGPLTVYGHSVSKPFTFTAQGTNALTIAPTFMLYDNAKFIGLATNIFTVGTWTTTFANTNMIIINDDAAASPYPSIINVSGVGNTLVKATVTITNLTHTSPSDIDALVVAPATNTLIMAHAGIGNIIKHVTLTFDDSVSNNLPLFTNLPQYGQIVSGTNHTTQYNPPNKFP